MLDENVPPVSFLEELRLNLPKWRYIVVGLISAFILAALEPFFTIILSKIIAVFVGTDKEAIGEQAMILSLMFVGLGVLIFVPVRRTVSLSAYIYAITIVLSRAMISFALTTCCAFGIWFLNTGRMDFESVILSAILVLCNAWAAAYIMEPAIDNLLQEVESPDHFDGNVRFEDVWFNYPSRPDVPILKGLNLEVAQGETVALMGSSGCGKSTIMQLLERFYDPREGRVVLDGRDMKQLNIHWVRAQVAFVSEDPVLFKCSLAKNIAYGDNSRTVTMEEIQAAAEAANIHTFIEELPQKYETQVGDKGMQLSGGQKQRIAIARAILRNPKVLLLDEAASALDTESEMVVLDKARQGRTCIVVTHCLSILRKADRIAVLQGGVVVEQGTHQQLLAKKGVYFMSVAMQLCHGRV
ncbi:phosphatidylcholine translocator ABCB4-like [Genypterus blacodes]|uniref:phosphatidylcholine translocator ABCB4-like n=1 Tax=Genypterus blacodes TaxID=154954 RepID=UPI003F75F9CF